MKKNLTAIVLVIFFTSCSEKKELDENSSATEILRELHGANYANYVKQVREEKIEFEKEILSKIKAKAKKEISEQKLVNNKETISQLMKDIKKTAKVRDMPGTLLSFYKIIYLIDDPKSELYRKMLKKTKTIEGLYQMKLEIQHNRTDLGNSASTSPPNL